jgi:transglutaminase-like putative cysteine protease
VILNIRHSMQFKYSDPIFIEPLTIRLTPRADNAQRVISFDLAINPEPAGQSAWFDLGGNAVTTAWFEGTHAELTIVADSRVETLRSNPFDFLLEPSAIVLPLQYEESVAALAAAYQAPAVDPLVRDFAEAIAEEVDRRTTDFLSTLAGRIRETFTSIERPEGDPWPAAETLSGGTGACRDLALLFMEASQTMGLAARFVSGYWLQEERIEEPELHAWAEVYLPGAGWRGWDPTAGGAVADEHVAVAAGREPRLAAPTSGTFRGSGIRSSLTATVHAATVDVSSV